MGSHVGVPVAIRQLLNILWSLFQLYEMGPKAVFLHLLWAKKNTIISDDVNAKTL